MKIAHILAFVIACPSLAGAQEVYVELSITDEFTLDAYKTLRLEVNTTGTFFAANGGFASASGAGFPTSGTCVKSGATGIFCALQSGYLSFGLELDQNLNGRVTAQDGSGTQFDSSPVTLILRRPVTP